MTGKRTMPPNIFFGDEMTRYYFIAVLAAVLMNVLIQWARAEEAEHLPQEFWGAWIDLRSQTTPDQCMSSQYVSDEQIVLGPDSWESALSKCSLSRIQHKGENTESIVVHSTCSDGGEGDFIFRTKDDKLWVVDLKHPDKDITYSRCLGEAE